MVSDNPDMTAILVAALDEDSPQNRESAFNELNRLADINFASYIGRLTQEMGDSNKPQKVRHLAGIMLKGALEAKSEEQQSALNERWTAQKDELKRAIRSLLIPIMSSPIRDIARTAGLLVAKIAAIDYPRKEWPDLLGILINNSQRGVDPSLRMATYDCVGYMCEDIPEYLAQNSADVLNIINMALQPEENDADVKFAASRALANAIQFARENFKSEVERSSILKLIFSACSSPDERIRREGFYALARVPEYYYEYLNPSIMDFAFTATTECMLKDRDEIGQQAIEFWCYICDREIENELQHQTAKEENWPAEEREALLLPLHNIMKRAVQTLAPSLLTVMIKKENHDEDVPSAASYASFCLAECAQAVKNDILPHVVPFIQQCLPSPEWNTREAAVLAFGCIIDGPDENIVKDLLQGGFPPVLSRLMDDNPIVKDSAAWVLGQVCHAHPGLLNFMLDDIFRAMLYGMRQSPKVARHICWAIEGLSDHISTVQSSDANTNALSPAFPELLTGLFWCSERTDGGQDLANLVNASYEAINHLIAAAVPDVYRIVQQVLPALMKRLTATIQRMETVGNDEDARQKLHDLQAIICGSLHVILQIRDFPLQVLNAEADNLMAVFLKVLEDGAKHSAVVEDVFVCMGCIALRFKERFQRYLKIVRVHLLNALKDSAQTKVLRNAIDFAGDLTRSLGPIFMDGALSDDVMKELLSHLQAQKIDRTIKPLVIGCIGDVALAVEGEFIRYMGYVMPLLVAAAHASSSPINPKDPEEQDFMIALRESLLDAFVSILQGLGERNAQEALLSWPQTNEGAVPIILFIGELMKERSIFVTSHMLSSACGFIEDFSKFFDPPIVEAHLRRNEIKLLLDRASQDNDKKTSQAADSARKKLEKKIGKRLQ